MKKNDPVKHPSHYTEGRKFEPKDVIRDWGLNFNLGNALKYIARAGRKDDIVQDLKKAQEYTQFEIDAIVSERKGATPESTPNCRYSITPVIDELMKALCEEELLSVKPIMVQVPEGVDVDKFIKSITGQQRHKVSEHIIPVTVREYGDMKTVSYKSDEVEVPMEVSLEEALAFLLAHFGETGEED